MQISDKPAYNRRTWGENNRREVAEDRKIGRIILTSLAALVLLCGLFVVSSGKVRKLNIADRSEPMTAGSTGTVLTTTPTK